MNTTELESRVRDVLASQSAALEPPDVRPDDAVVVTGPASTAFDRQPRRRVLLAAAAALVVIAGTAVAARHADDTVQYGSPATGGFRALTHTVELSAASIEVDANGHTFTPPADVTVDGDPGMYKQYTTLELTWFENGTEMRVNMYFTSDGTDWWADKVWTYNGKSGDAADWIENDGQFFRTPIGSAFHGDFDQQSLHIHGMTLQAFLRPRACDQTTTPIAVDSGYTRVDAKSGPGFGYGINVTMMDTATCTPVAADRYDVAVTADDSAIVSGEPSGYDVGPNMINIQLRLLSPGSTTMHVVVTDKTTGQLVGQLDIPVHLT